MGGRTVGGGREGERAGVSDPTEEARFAFCVFVFVRERGGRKRVRRTASGWAGVRGMDGMGSTRGTRPVPGDAPGGRRGGFLSRVPRVRRRSVRRAPSRARRGDRGRRPRARTARGRALARATREGAARDPGRRGRARERHAEYARAPRVVRESLAERGRDGERAARARSLRRGAEPASRGAGHDARRTDRAPRLALRSRSTTESPLPPIERAARPRRAWRGKSRARSRTARSTLGARFARFRRCERASRDACARTSASGPDETADSAELSVSDALRRLSRVQLMPGTKLQLEHPA